MAFKISKSKGQGAESPEALLRDLKTKKIVGPLADQADLWRAYQAEALEASDVALHLPTGGGKTLVGVVLAEWRRRTRGERVVYLCPTRQLVNQVAEQAAGKFGIPVAPFVGSKRDYDRGLTAQYQSAELVAVTTYSSLFNVSPYFNDAHVIVLDDAHAAENYIASMWSLVIEEYQDPVAYAAIANALKPALPVHHYQRLVDTTDGSRDRGWVDKLPSPALAAMADELVLLFDQLFDSGDNSYAWTTIRDHLRACHLYFSAGRFLVRPMFPPTSSHKPFANARQRIYMSATLGEAGELERITGRAPIRRLAPNVGWERQTIGRRYFMFPGRSLDEEDQLALNAELIRKAGRAVVLTPDDRRAREFKTFVQESVGAPVFGARDIEASKSDFVSASTAVAVVANRYDGIDFPEEECRLLIVEGLPTATNLYEHFLITRLASSDVLRVRILGRMVQAFGRCTRSDKDFSAVVLRGEELSRYLLSAENRAPLHPELQAELTFGIEQSRDAAPADFIENFELFLRQGEDWAAANEAIVEERDSVEKQPIEGSEDLARSAASELKYMSAMWAEDYAGALEAARTTLGMLTSPKLKGYRALWYYLAGSAAWLAYSEGVSGADGVARQYFEAAQRAEKSLSWLGGLARLGLVAQSSTEGTDYELSLNIERIEALFDRLGSLNDHRFSKFEVDLRKKISVNDAKEFEQGHVMLGQLLGFDAGNRNDDASPDPWWRSSETFCIVFEDYTDAEGDTVPARKARQAATHPNWIKSELLVAENADVVSVMIAPCVYVERGAVPHMGQVIYWPTDDFRRIAEIAINVIKDLRREYPGAGDLAWRAMASERLRRSRLSPRELVRSLREEQPEMVSR